MLVAPRPPAHRARRAAARAAIVCLLTAGGAAAVAGCGSEEDEAPAVRTPAAEVRVRAVVRQFGVATATKDYAAICDRLIAKSLSDNVEEVGLPCEDAFERGLGAVEGARLRIDGVRLASPRLAYAKVHTTATGQPPSDDTLELVRVGSAWRIASLNAPAARVPEPAVVRLW